MMTADETAIIFVADSNIDHEDHNQVRFQMLAQRTDDLRFAY